MAHYITKNIFFFNTIALHLWPVLRKLFVPKGCKLIHFLVGIALPLLLAEMKFLRNIWMRSYRNRSMRQNADRREGWGFRKS